MNDVSAKILSDVGPFLAELARLGFEPVAARYDALAFGNYEIDLAGQSRSFSIVRDRLQYYIAGLRSEDLVAAGMLRAFNDRDSFREAVLSWLGAPEA